MTEQMRRFNPGNGGGVDTLIESLDQMNAGLMKWEMRIRAAIASGESGQHTLRVRIDGGVIRKVVHSVDDEM